MLYSYRYINKQVQFGSTNYTLILEDLDDLNMPIVRIDKCFNVDPNLIDNDFLYQQAKPDILNAMGYDPSNPPIAEKTLDVVEAIQDESSDEDDS